MYEWLRPDEMMESNRKLDWMYRESGSQPDYTGIWNMEHTALSTMLLHPSVQGMSA